MNYTKTITRLNGNGKRYTLSIPMLIIPKFGNEVAKKYFEKQTGLELVEYWTGYKTQPKTFKQLYKVFTTYNFKTTFYDNATYKNTLALTFNNN